MYRKKLFRIVSPTTYPKIIEIGEDGKLLNNYLFLLCNYYYLLFFVIYLISCKVNVPISDPVRSTRTF